MGVKDRTELGDDTYIPLTSVLEGVVVLRPNPEAGSNGAGKGGKKKAAGAAKSGAGAGAGSKA